MSRIHLTIDRLVLGGLDSTAREAFVAALTKELHNAIANPAARATWAHPHRTPVLRLNRMPLDPGAGGARKLGSQVAREIAGGLKP